MLGRTAGWICWRSSDGLPRLSSSRSSPVWMTSEHWSGRSVGTSGPPSMLRAASGGSRLESSPGSSSWPPPRMRQRSSATERSSIWRSLFGRLRLQPGCGMAARHHRDAHYRSSTRRAVAATGSSERALTAGARNLPIGITAMRFVWSPRSGAAPDGRQSQMHSRNGSLVDPRPDCKICRIRRWSTLIRPGIASGGCMYRGRVWPPRARPARPCVRTAAGPRGSPRRSRPPRRSPRR